MPPNRPLRPRLARTSALPLPFRCRLLFGFGAVVLLALAVFCLVFGGGERISRGFGRSGAPGTVVVTGCRTEGYDSGRSSRSIQCSGTFHPAGGGAAVPGVGLDDSATHATGTVLNAQYNGAGTVTPTTAYAVADAIGLLCVGLLFVGATGLIGLPIVLPRRCTAVPKRAQRVTLFLIGLGMVGAVLGFALGAFLS